MLRFDTAQFTRRRAVLPWIAAAALMIYGMCGVNAQSPTSSSPPAADNSTPPPPPPADSVTGAQVPPPEPAVGNSEPNGRPEKHHLGIGIDAEAFLPSDSKTRSRFGDTWLAAGIGIGNVRTASAHGSVGLDLRVLAQSSDDDRHVFVGLLGAEYRRAFNEDDVDEQREFIPYWGASADVDFVDISSPEDNVHSGVSGTGGGSLLVGTTIGQNEYVNVRYDEIASVRGFNLSGLGITAGVRF